MVSSRTIARLILGFGSLMGSVHPAELSKVRDSTKPNGSIKPDSGSTKPNGSIKPDSGSTKPNGLIKPDSGSTKPNGLIKPDSATDSNGATNLNIAASGMSIQVNGTTTKVPAECIATSYSTYSAIVAKCPTSILKDIKVPVDGQICLTGLDSKTVAFSGTTDFAASPGGRAPTFPLITFNSSSNSRIVGLDGSVINGHGEDYWDAGGGNTGIKKPKTMRIEKVTNSDIEGITILNPPVHCFAISNSDHVTLSSIKIDGSMADNTCDQITRTINRADTSGGKKSCGHNSDGFGISGSTHIKIQNSVVDNQDDCLAVNSGSDISFVGNYCTGGHGICIGSIKNGQVVNGVQVSNCTIRDSDNGIRIKSYDDATSASVTGISYKDITLENIKKFGIVIQQDYRNEGPTGKAGNTVPIKGVNLQNIHGTVSSTAQAIYINCGTSTCTNWKFTDIAITGGTITKAPPSGCIAPPTNILPFCGRGRGYYR